MVASNNPYGPPPGIPQPPAGMNLLPFNPGAGAPQMPQGFAGPSAMFGAMSPQQLMAAAGNRPQMPQMPGQGGNNPYAGMPFNPGQPPPMPPGWQGPNAMLGASMPGMAQAGQMDPAMLAAANQRPQMNAQGQFAPPPNAFPGMAPMPQMPMQPFGALAGSQPGQGQGAMQRRQQMPPQARGRDIGFQRTRGY